VSEPAPAAPRTPTAIALELRVATIQGEPDRRVALPFGAAVLVRRGGWQGGFAAEGEPHRPGPDWLAPGATSLKRTSRVVAFSLGASTPVAGPDGGRLLRHLRLELLGEAGVLSTEMVESLGVGGIGDRRWKRTTPFLGVRAGTRLWFGGSWGGHFGLAAYYRQPLRDERVTTIAGGRAKLVTPSFGFAFYGGPYHEQR
jgi:hypothetical protein